MRPAGSAAGDQNVELKPAAKPTASLVLPKLPSSRTNADTLCFSSTLRPPPTKKLSRSRLPVFTVNGLPPVANRASMLFGVRNSCCQPV